MEIPAGAIIMLSCILAYLTAKATKNLIKLFHGNWNWKQLFASGGMPSSHTAIVSALATGVFFNQGLSVSFAIASALLAVVVVDTLGIRRNVGRLALTVNRFHNTSHPTNQGHDLYEVLAGVLVGILSNVVMWLIFS